MSPCVSLSTLPSLPRSSLSVPLLTRQGRHTALLVRLDGRTAVRAAEAEHGNQSSRVFLTPAE